MVRSVVERFGRLDIAVNNAGIGILGADEEMDQASWDKGHRREPDRARFSVPRPKPNR